MSNSGARAGQKGKTKQFCVGLDNELRAKVDRIQRRITDTEGKVSTGLVIRRLLKTHPEVINA